jgi:hypothetical protein
MNLLPMEALLSSLCGCKLAGLEVFGISPWTAHASHSTRAQEMSHFHVEFLILRRGLRGMQMQGVVCSLTSPVIDL